MNSNGDCCKYGHDDEYTRLNGVAYEWIQANLLDDNVGGAVPIEDCSIYPKWKGDDGGNNEIRKLFKKYAKKDDLLSIGEFKRMYRKECDNDCKGMNKRQKNKRAKQLLAQWDVTGDKKLSLAEFTKLYKSLDN